MKSSKRDALHPSPQYAFMSWSLGTGAIYIYLTAMCSRHILELLVV
jgi:hypothetical protein